MPGEERALAEEPVVDGDVEASPGAVVEQPGHADPDVGHRASWCLDGSLTQATRRA